MHNDTMSPSKLFHVLPVGRVGDPDVDDEAGRKELRKERYEEKE